MGKCAYCFYTELRIFAKLDGNLATERDLREKLNQSEIESVIHRLVI